MKKALFMAIALIALMVGCNTISIEQSDYVYTISADMHVSGNYADVYACLREAGCNVGDMKVYTGTVNDCDKQAKVWFEDIIKDIDSDRMSSILEADEYVRLKLLRNGVDDNEPVEVTAKEYRAK